MEMVEEYKSLLRRLSKNYNSIYVVRYDGTKIMPFVINSDVSKAIASCHNLDDSFSSMINIYAEKYVVDEEREAFKKIITLENIKQKLSSGSSYTVTLKRKNTLDKVEVIELKLVSLSSECFAMIFSNSTSKHDEIEHRALKSIYETLGSGIWSIKFTSDLKIKSAVWSNLFRKLLGYESQQDFPDDFNSWLNVLHPDEKEKVLKDFKDTINGTAKLFNEELRMNTNQKGYKWFHMAGIIAYSDDNKPLYFYGVLVDIDERKINQMNVDKAKREKEQDFYILTSISDVYLSMHLIDILENFVIEYSSTDIIRKWVNRNIEVDKQLYEVMDNLVTDEYKQRMFDFINLKTLRERMKGKKIITCEFIGKINGWIRASFILVEKDMHRMPLKVLFTTQIIQEEKERELDLLFKSKNDELTGLNNRRAYEEDIAGYLQNGNLETNFVFISMDLNGLKNANDTLGHEAGDRLITESCKCMKQVFGGYGKLYRTGGDEFCGIIFADDKKLEELKRDFETTLQNCDIGNGIAPSVSCGYVTKKEFPDMELSEIIKIADKRMYDDKENFYSKNGMDKRGQQEAFDALCNSYKKILKLNIRTGSYRIIFLAEGENMYRSDSDNNVFNWLNAYVESGNVHPDDVKKYYDNINEKFLTEYFTDSAKHFIMHYRRKSNDSFKESILEIVPSKKFSQENMEVFLYVKDIC